MPDTFWVVVLRAFEVAGVRLVPETLVDAGNWPLERREKLIKQRWVRPATAQEVAAAEEEEEVEVPVPPPPRAKKRSKK